MSNGVIDNNAWRLIDNAWFIFKNNLYKLKSAQTNNNNNEKNKEKNKEKDVKKQKTDFYFQKKKVVTKGTIVYTIEGYGILTDISQDVCQVKINGVIKQFNKNDLQTDIQIGLKFIIQNRAINETLSIPVSTTGQELNKIIEPIIQDVYSETDTIMHCKLYHQGKEILSSSQKNLEELQVFPNSVLLGLLFFGKPKTCARFKTVYTGWGYWNSLDGLGFTTDKDCFIAGFGLYKPSSQESIEYDAKFVVGADCNGDILFEKKVLVPYDGDQVEKIHQFFFDKPIKIKANQEYACVTNTKKGTSYYGCNGSNSVEENNITFNFLNCIGNTNGSMISSGVIPEIYFI